MYPNQLARATLDMSVIYPLLLSIYFGFSACLLTRFHKLSAAGGVVTAYRFCVLCSQPVVAGSSLVILTMSILTISLTPICNPILLNIINLVFQNRWATQQLLVHSGNCSSIMEHVFLVGNHCSKWPCQYIQDTHGPHAEYMTGEHAHIMTTVTVTYYNICMQCFWSDV